jgi:glyoxylase-like metal-dependent hydrolase (beta-lactamase superfamily II)
MKKILTVLLATALYISTLTGALANEKIDAPFNVKVYNADANSFHVNSVLLTGKQEAMLIDAQFTRSDAHRLVADILNSKKNLTTIYVSHGDPDFYFGLEVIKQAFPDVAIYASKPTIAWIKKTVEKKVGFWGPKMGSNAPRNTIIPDELPSEGLILEGQKLEVKGVDGQLSRRSYVWIPSIKAVVGGVNVFSGLHLWTADTQTKSDRAGWLDILNDIETLAPEIVIPGHSDIDAPKGLEAVAFSKSYLQRYEIELDKAANAEELINKMLQLYPSLGLEIALSIGSRVNKGEMKW